MIVVLHNIKWSGEKNVNPPTQVWDVQDDLSEQEAVNRARELSENVALDSQKIGDCKFSFVIEAKRR